MQTSLDLKQLQYQMEQAMQLDRQGPPDEEWALSNEGGDDNFKVIVH